MNDLNSVLLVGRLTKDMELSYTSGGAAIGKFSLAVNRSRKNENEWTEEVSYFEIKCFGKTAENLKPYLIKGKQVGVIGYLKQDRWKKDGQKFSKITVGAEMIQLLGSNSSANNSAPSPYDVPFENQNGYGYSN